MKLNSLGTAAVTALAMMMAFSSSASATSLEIAGVKQLGAITVKKSLASGTGSLFTDTTGTFVNTCTGSTEEWTTTVFTGTRVEGTVSSSS